MADFLFWISPLNPLTWIPYFALLVCVLNVLFKGDVAGGCYYHEPPGGCDR